MQRPEFSNWVELLEFRARTQPNRLALKLLGNGVQETDALTYSQLYQKAQALGSILQSLGSPGDRALILLPNNLDFLVAFFGCLCARIIAVPAYPPKANRNQERLLRIVKQSGSKIIIFNKVISKGKLLESFGTEGKNGITYLNLDEIDLTGAHDLASQNVQGNDVAFLQYTSGSTGHPKGVILSHENLLSNMTTINWAMEIDDSSTVLSWLPLYHDMGLIGCVLQPLFAGCPGILMPPASFLQRPLDWLKALSVYRATITGAPNFAFELCVRKFTPEEANGIDLRHLELIFNGSEPIRARSLNDFCALYEPYGFDRRALFPCYGLAEASLFVSGGPKGAGISVARVKKDGLENSNLIGSSDSDAIPLVSSGMVGKNVVVKIVSLATNSALMDRHIGEIWISGPNVSSGYWENIETTTATFGISLPEYSGLKFCRTGDLGFLHEGRLTVTGRLKDLIIVSGKNYYPQDIEESVNLNMPEVSISSAFALESQSSECLGLVVELDRGYLSSDLSKLAEEIAIAIAHHHEIVVTRVAFVKPGGLPRTSSGKLQRNLTKKNLLDGSLDCIFDWQANEQSNSLKEKQESNPATPKAIELSARVTAKKREIRDYLGTRLNVLVAHDRKTLPPNIILDLGNMGLMGMIVPIQHGGLGYTCREIHAIGEQLGSIDISLALYVGLNNLLGLYPLVAYGDDAQKRQFLPKLSAGRGLASFALSESTAGSNPKAMSSKAIRTPNGNVRLYGEKVWIGLAPWSSVITIFCKELDSEGRNLGVSAFLVPSDQPGISFGPEAMTMGACPVVQASVILNAVEVNDSHRLGRPGKGLSVAFGAMNLARMGLASVALGAMKRCYQILEKYVSSREINTGLMIDNGFVKQQLANTSSAILVTTLLLDHLADLTDSKKAVPEELYLVCKIAAPEFLWEVVDSTMQLLGGRGYIESNFIPQLFRDARLLRIFEGPTETLCYHLGAIVWKNSGGTLISTLGGAAPRLGTLEEDIAMLKRTLGEQRDQETDQLVFCALGKLASLTFLRALCEGREGDLETGNWLDLQYRLTLATIKNQVATRLANTAANPKNLAKGYFEQVGLVIPSLPGEDWSRAEFLVNDPAAGEEDVRADHPVIGPAHLRIDPLAPERLPSHRPKTDPDSVKMYLIELIKQVRQHSKTPIRDNSPYATLGIDSLAAAEILVAVEERYGIALPETVLWDYPTVQKTANLICDTLNNKTRSS